MPPLALFVCGLFESHLAHYFFYRRILAASNAVLFFNQSRARLFRSLFAVFCHVYLPFVSLSISLVCGGLFRLIAVSNLLLIW